MESKKGKQNGESGRLKKQEKPPSESHRDYLDMNSDEEEFGRQETPEPEEEAPPEPERPVFTKEQLNTLVRLVKDITVLPNLLNSHWNKECESIICEYFEDPKKTILTLYFEKGRLIALLDFPTATDNGLVYFLRSPWHVYNVDNFLKTVTFGSINGNVENTIFKFLENIYAPMAIKNTEWREVIRNDVFSSLNEFFICAMRHIYQPMSLTILYIPREGLNLKVDNFVHDKRIINHNDPYEIQQMKTEREEFIGRLDKIVRTWIQQIREALTVLPITDEKLKDVNDEIEYWNTKYDNLSCLQYQLKNEHVVKIIEMFEDANSSSVVEFRPLCIKIQRSLEEAASNLTHLNLILEACKMLQSPESINEFLPKVLLFVRFVWLESPFYNTSKNIQALLKALSVRIMDVCRGSVNLEAVFHGEANKTKEAMNSCLDCCRNYSEVYDNMMDECLANNEEWNINKDEVFACIKAFTQRCDDIVEICRAAFFFGGSNKLNFVGPRGKQRELYYEQIEASFFQAMKDMEDPCKNALDITTTEWFENMKNFRLRIADLENLVTNLIDEVFESMKNVEFGIETLYALQRFRLQNSFRKILNQKWSMVWQVFEEELKLSSATLLESTYVDRSYNIKYLVRQYDMLINASDWMGDCEFQRDIIKTYKSVLSRFHAKQEEQNTGR